MTASEDILLNEDDAGGIAKGLAEGRPVHRNGSGWKTWCPYCEKRTLSVAVSKGRPLLKCHNRPCAKSGTDLLLKLVKLGLLPDTRKGTSKALETVKEIQGCIEVARWTYRGGHTDRKVLLAMCEVSQQCGKSEFDAGLLDVAVAARCDSTTASRSLSRLERDGWVKRLRKGTGKQASSWILIVSDKYSHAMNVEPGSSVTAPGSTLGYHDAFRYGALGPAKGRIYDLLTVPRNFREIAKVLGYTRTSTAKRHLEKMVTESIAVDLPDGYYGRGPADLDVVAGKYGVLGKTDQQVAANEERRDQYRLLLDLCDHWRRTGEIIDPSSGALLETRAIPNEAEGTIQTFRQLLTASRFLSWRAPFRHMSESSIVRERSESTNAAKG